MKSKHNPAGKQPDTVILWVKGYDVTQEEKEKGYTGNFAVVSCQKEADAKWTLGAEKLAVALEKHPHRRRPHKKHPDWGYWVLRRVKKGWTYSRIEDAYADLMTLAEDFPAVSIPGRNKLYTIIYQKQEDDRLPLFRVVLEVEAGEKGGFIIACRENTYRAPVAGSAVDTDKPPPGKFAARVTARRHKRTDIAGLPQEDG